MTSSTTSPPSIVSGQQVGLLGGPLFILYKILGVYRLAETSGEGWVEPQSLKPVFWMEGNDADLEEINIFHGVDSRCRIQTYRWRPQQLRGQPIGNYLVDRNLLRLYHDYFEALPVTRHSDVVQDLVFQSYRLGETLWTANQNFFSLLFKDFEGSWLSHNSPDSNRQRTEMTWFRPDQEDFLKFSQDLLSQEVERTQEGQCPVFVLLNGRREALFKKERVCVTRLGKKVDFKNQTLLPSVWNRSILQDAYLKAKAYVAGPAEEVYLRKLVPTYDRYRIQPARVIPRMSVTITDLVGVKASQDLGLEVEEIIEKSQDHLIARFQEGDPILKTTLKALREKLKREKQEAVREYRVSHPDVKPTRKHEKSLYVKMKHQLGQERKDFKARRRKDLIRLQALVNSLHPLTKGVGSSQVSQERFHNLTTFLNFYGIKAIDTIYREYQFEKKTICLRRG